MDTINQVSHILINLIRAGLGLRIVYCCVRIMFAEDEQGMYKRRIKNSLICVVINELVWLIKELVIAYF